MTSQAFNPMATGSEASSAALFSGGLDPFSVGPDQDLMQTLWHSVDYGLWVLEVGQNGTTFRVLYCNPVMAAIVAVPCAELIGQTLIDIFNPEQAETYLTECRRALQQAQTVCFENRLGGAGPTEWCTRITPLRDQSGQIHRLVATTIERCDRTAVEAKIEQSKQVLQQVIDNLPMAIVWKDRNSVYEGGNLAVAKIAGLNHPRELVGKTDYDMPWKPEETEWFLECDRRIMADATPELGIIEPQLQADGKQAWLRTSKVPLYDGSGEVNGILVVIEDITDRKAAEAAVLLRDQAMAVSPVGIVIVDAKESDLPAAYVNPAFEQQTGYTADEVLGQNFRFLQGDDRSQPEIDKIRAALAEGHRCTVMLRNYRKDGSLFWNELTIAPIFDVQGNITHFMGLQNDVSDRKATELKLKRQAETLRATLKQLKRTQLQMLQSEKMSSLGQLVAGVAHEINNPVGFIHGNLQPAQQYAEDLLNLIRLYHQVYPEPDAAIAAEIKAIDLAFIQQDFPRLLDSMEMGTQRIREIVLSLRNFSRLDESERKAVDIHEGIENTLVILGSRLKGTDDMPAIEVIKDYGQLPPIECYPGQLNQVFMNLLTNAMDALEARFGAEGVERDEGDEEAQGAGEDREDVGVGVGRVPAHFGSEFSATDSLPKSKIVRLSAVRLSSPSKPHDEVQNLKSKSKSPQITIRTELISTNQVRITIADNGT
ncbi:MAG: PAS domain S-box protein, partial [Cyanobacteria bacterium P01_D01_bin.44]